MGFKENPGGRGTRYKAGPFRGHMLNERGRCPVCGRNLDHFDEEGVRKHMHECKRKSLSKGVTGGRRGRPRVHHPIRTPKGDDEVKEENRGWDGGPRR